MEIEEAIIEIKDASDSEVRYGDTKHHHDEVIKRVEAFDMAIKALEQQPCEDCVSRKLLSDNICEGISCNECSFNEIDGESGCLLQKRFDELPSVQPTRPTARWERLVEDYNKCSKCGEMGKLYRIYKYCPNCGAKMAESEDKDADSN